MAAELADSMQQILELVTANSAALGELRVNTTGNGGGEWQDLLPMIGIILTSGLFGGWVAYLRLSSSINFDANDDPQALKRSLALSLCAAVLTPVALKMAGSEVLGALVSKGYPNPVYYLVFAGFCMVSSLSAGPFIQKVTREIDDQYKRTTEGKLEKLEAEDERLNKHEKAAKAALEDLKKVIVESKRELDEFREAAQPSIIATTHAVTAEKQNQETVLHAFTNSPHRTLHGLVVDTNLSKKQVGTIVHQLTQEGLLQQIDNLSGPSWYRPDCNALPTKNAL